MKKIGNYYNNALCLCRLICVLKAPMPIQGVNKNEVLSFVINLWRM